MYLLFIDESGNPSLGTRNVSTVPAVIAGLAIPDGAWRPLDIQFRSIKLRYGVTGELKWRSFAPQEDALVHLSVAQKTALRQEIYSLLLRRNAIRIIAVVGTPSVYTAHGFYRTAQDGFYQHAIKCLSERFQYFLQDMSRDTAVFTTGLLVCDARDRAKDQRLVRGMHSLLQGGMWTADYKNIVEGLFMADSALSTGVQLADLVAGAIWHKEARGNDRWYNVIEPRIRRDAAGNVAGWGIVRI